MPFAMVTDLHPGARSAVAAAQSLRGRRCAGLPRLRSSFSARIHRADARDRTDAAEVRLRQVYAELGGVVGGSHKSERRTLFRKITDKVRVGARSEAA